MAEPFLSEIRIMSFEFAPKGWALFSLLGTTYGGNGTSTFALPDMQGNVPMQHGQGQGLSQRFLGENSGAEFVTLLASEMPAHTHSAQATTAIANTNQPASAMLARGQYSFQGQSGAVPIYFNGAPDVQKAPQALAIGGSSLPHNNMQPYLTVNFNIALQGVFPARP